MELFSAGIYVAFVPVALIVYAWSAIYLIVPWRRALAVFLALALFSFGETGLRAIVYQGGALEPALEGRDVQLSGVVVQMPQRNEAGLRFRLRVESATLDGAPVTIPNLIDGGWYGGVYATGTEVMGLQRQPQDIRAGERWQMVVRLKAVHGSRNPHGFDYELWLWEQGVQATAYVRAGARDAPPVLLGQTWRYPVALARQTVRDRIFADVSERQIAGVIAALVAGDQGAIERVDWDVFRATGVSHLVSISGLHITMFAWGASLLVGWLWRRSGRLCLALPAPTAAMLGGLLLACAYAWFSGWGVPAQRTCLMLGTLVGLRWLGARWPWPQVWMLACAVVVALDPWALLQPGFWLSFVAVGILFATDLRANEPIDIRGKWRLFAFLREQWVITAGLAPLTLLLFGQMSVVGLVANVFAVPWVTLVVTPLAMLGVAMPGGWEVAAWATQLLLVVLQWLAGFSWAALTIAVPPLWVGLAGLAAGIVLVFPWPLHMRLLGLPLLVPLVVWQPAVPAPGHFELLAADVGQGNAVLVRTANHALLYDTGPRYSLESDAGHRVLVPLLKALDIRLDRVVLSHRDSDHVGGAAAVLAMQPQADVLSSIEPEHPLQALRSAQRCAQGQSWEWDGVRFEVLHPGDDDYAQKSKPNALSCVLRVSNGIQAVLLAGDIEKTQEARLVESGVVLKSDVLLVPHHGSKTSSSDAFLDAVQPAMALVQAGYRSRYGHPAPPVLSRYGARTIKVFNSPHCGAATWNSERSTELGCFRAQSLRYWHHRVP